jgi:hypothetical protein
MTMHGCDVAIWEGLFAKSQGNSSPAIASGEDLVISGQELLVNGGQYL